MNNLRKMTTFTCGKFAFALAALLSTGAVWADSGDSWTFTLNEGSTTQGLLTSGNWTLKAQLNKAGSDQLSIGNGGWTTAEAYVAGDGLLDLTVPIYQGDKKLVLKGVLRTSFWNLSSSVKIKRIILPETVDNVATYAFAGVSSADKLIVRSTNVVSLTERVFFNTASMKRLDLGLPNVTAANTAAGVLSNSKHNTLCFDATGYGTVSTNMLGGPSFTNLVLKTVNGQKLLAKAFTTRNVQRICLTGDCPDLSAGTAEPRKDNCIFGDQWLGKGSVLFCIPYGNETYAAWRTAATALTELELATFRTRYPNDPAPLGWISGSLCGTYNDQYLCEFNPLVWENSLVISAEGEYAHLFTDARTIYGLDDGETLTLAPSPWVVEGVRYAVTGGKIERPLGNATGWSSEEFSGTSYTFVQQGEEGARLTWKVEKLYQKPTIVTDYSPYSETVTAVADTEPVEEGFYPAGTKWTLTVKDIKTTIPQSHFVRWVGDVPAGHETDMPLVITPTNGAVSIRAEILHDWVYEAYDANAKTNMITDGVWKLRASLDRDRVVIGNNWVAGGGFLEGPSAPTLLDLSGAITDESGNEKPLYSIHNPAFKKIPNISSLRIVSSTLAALGAETFYGLPDLGDVYLDVPNCQSINYSCFSLNPNLTNLVVHADNLTSCAPGTPYRPFSDNTKLVKAELKLPKLTYLTQRFLENSPLMEVDYSTWDLSSVQWVDAYAFHGTKVTADLSLPALREVRSWSFYAAKCDATLTLGTKYLTNLCDNAFVWCASIKNVTLGNAKKLIVGPQAFLGDRPDQAGSSVAPTSLAFLGHAPTQEAIDNLLASVAEKSGAKDCTVYASFKFPGWSNLASALTEEETTAAAEAGINPRGVYRDGSRKAWMIDRKSPYDPSGFLMILR